MPLSHSPTKMPQLLKTPPVMSHSSSDTALNTSAIGVDSDILDYVSKRQKRNFTDFSKDSSLGLSGIKSMFDEMKSQHDEKFDSLNNALAVIITQNNEIQKSVSTMNTQYSELLARVGGLVQENHEHKSRITTLENKVEYLERQAQSSSIEIRNTPKQDHENKCDLITIVENIGVTLGLDTSIQRAEIRDIFRLKNGTIVVNFSGSVRKQDVILGYKTFN